MESTSNLISLTTNNLTYGTRVEEEKKEEDQKLEVFLEPKASVYALSKNPAAAESVKAIAIHSKPKDEAPIYGSKQEYNSCKLYEYSSSKETINNTNKEIKKFKFQDAAIVYIPINKVK